MAFEEAVREHVRLRLALAGPAGSGKTLSALRVAKGMAQVLGCRIGLIDTEKKSSTLYAGANVKGQLLPEDWQVKFAVLPFNPPFPPVKYVKGIKVAEQEGVGILIIDSLSHAWFGEGGLLEMVDAFTAADPKKNQFAAWKKATPEQTRLVEAILQSSLHIIATMRSKVAWEVVKDENTGRTKPQKIGMAPIQREGLDYEFTTWLDLSVESHMAVAGKDRTGLFDSVPRVLTEETGLELVNWLNGNGEQKE
jgi:hypothetical protein